MSYLLGVNLLPSTGEFTYDTIAYLGQRITESSLTSINRYANGGPPRRHRQRHRLFDLD